MASTGPITLEEVRTAIRTVLTVGQSYRARDGTMYTLANLDQLQRMERELLAAQAGAAAGITGFTGYGRFNVTMADEGDR